MKKIIIFGIAVIVFASLANADYMISEFNGEFIYCTGDEVFCDLFNDDSVDWTTNWYSQDQTLYVETNYLFLNATAGADKGIFNIYSLNPQTTDGFTCEFMFEAIAGDGSYVTFATNNQTYNGSSILIYKSEPNFNYGFSGLETHAQALEPVNYTVQINFQSNSTNGTWNMSVFEQIQGGSIVNILNVTENDSTILNYTELYFSMNGWNGKSNLYYISCWNGTRDNPPYLLNPFSDFLMDNCTNPVFEEVLNITVRDFTTDALLPQYAFEGIFNLWHESNPSYVKNFSFSYESINYSNKFCMNPSDNISKSDFQMLFTKTGYSSTQYSEFGSDLNTTSQQYLTIYLTNSSLSTEVVIILVDENDEELSGYAVEAYKYTLGTDSYELVGGEVSGSNGKVAFDLDVSTYEYRFIVKQPNGSIIHTEPRQKLLDTEYTFRILLGTSTEFVQSDLYQLDITLSADRPNKNFTLTWSGISGLAKQIRLEVTKQNYSTLNVTTTLSNQSSTSTSGLLFYNITDDTVNQSITYTASVYVTAIADNIEYYIDSKTIDYLKEWDIFGDESLFGAFFLVGTLIFIGVAMSATAAIILGGMGMVISLYMGLYMVSFSALIGLITGLFILLARMKRK
jgi:hypothetical protein